MRLSGTDNIKLVIECVQLESLVTYSRWQITPHGVQYGSDPLVGWIALGPGHSWFGLVRSGPFVGWSGLVGFVGGSGQGQVQLGHSSFSRGSAATCLTCNGNCYRDFIECLTLSF